MDRVGGVLVGSPSRPPNHTLPLPLCNLCVLCAFVVNLPSLYPPTRRAWLRATLAGLAAGPLAGAGCRPVGADLVVATDWSDSELADLETALAPSRLAWVRPTNAADPTALVSRGLPADAVLGGPLSSYARLDAEGRLAGHWAISRVAPLGLALADRPRAGRPIEGAASWHELGEPEWSGRLAMDDPRGNPIALAVAAARLASGPWPEAYAELVRAAGQARPLDVGAGSALAQLVRGAADATPTAAHRVAGRSGLSFIPWPELGDWREGAAVLSGARDPARAVRLVREVAGRLGGAARSSPWPADPATASLLADLLGATLVESRAELRAALATLRSSDRPEADAAAAWMVQSPPWPPASIGVLRTRGDANALLQALADQIAPEPEVRAWLLASWDRPEAPIDGAWLAELAGAVGGRLVGEPRFREWLRGEWVAWARQRYRRVRRKAEGRV